jgi:hypothetical protein
LQKEDFPGNFDLANPRNPGKSNTRDSATHVDASRGDLLMFPRMNHKARKLASKKLPEFFRDGTILDTYGPPSA